MGFRLPIDEQPVPSYQFLEHVQTAPVDVEKLPATFALSAIDVVQTIAIVGTLILTYLQFRSLIQSNRAYTAIHLSNSHREIWTHLFDRPELERTVDPAANPEENPVSKLEEYFVIMVINHMATVFDAHDEGLHDELYERDIADFLSLPVPYKVWSDVRDYQNEDFVTFVDSLLENRQSA